MLGFNAPKKKRGSLSVRLTGKMLGRLLDRICETLEFWASFSLKRFRVTQCQNRRCEQSLFPFRTEKVSQE